MTNFILHIELEDTIKEYEMNILEAQRIIENYFYAFHKFIVISHTEIYDKKDIKSIKIVNFELALQ